MPDPITLLTIASIGSKIGGSFFRGRDLAKFQDQYQKDASVRNAVAALSRGSLQLQPTVVAPKESGMTKFFDAVGTGADLGLQFMQLKDGLARQKKQDSLLDLQLENAQQEAEFTAGQRSFRSLTGGLTDLPPEVMRNPEVRAGFDQTARDTAFNALGTSGRAGFAQEQANDSIRKLGMVNSRLEQMNKVRELDIAQKRVDLMETDYNNEAERLRQTKAGVQLTAQNKAFDATQEATADIIKRLQDPSQGVGFIGKRLLTLSDNANKILALYANAQNLGRDLTPWEQNTVQTLFATGVLEPGLAFREDDRRAVEERTRGALSKLFDLGTKLSEGQVLNPQQQGELLSSLRLTADTAATYYTEMVDDALANAPEMTKINYYNKQLGQQYDPREEIRNTVVPAWARDPDRLPSQILGQSYLEQTDRIVNEARYQSGQFIGKTPESSAMLDKLNALEFSGKAAYDTSLQGLKQPQVSLGSSGGFTPLTQSFSPLARAETMQFGMNDSGPSEDTPLFPKMDSEQGFRLLRQDLQAKLSGKNDVGLTGESTIQDFARIWAPNDRDYAKKLGQKLGTHPLTKLNHYQDIRLDYLVRAVAELGY